MADIYEFLNKDLYRTSADKDSADSIRLPGNETYSETLISGEIDGTMSFTGGFTQSKNFVTGSAGWRLSRECGG